MLSERVMSFLPQMSLSLDLFIVIALVSRWDKMLTLKANCALPNAPDYLHISFTGREVGITDQ